VYYCFKAEFVATKQFEASDMSVKFFLICSRPN